jgi:hypothetical protein
MHLEKSNSAPKCARQAYKQFMNVFFKIAAGQATDEDYSHYLQTWHEAAGPDLSNLCT